MLSVENLKNLFEIVNLVEQDIIPINFVKKLYHKKILGLKIISPESRFGGNKKELEQLCIQHENVIRELDKIENMEIFCQQSFELLKQFSEQTGIDSSVIRVIFKIIGIGYIVELTASSVKDLGFESIADKLVMCGRIVIFLVSVPVLKSLYDVIVSLIGLV